MSYRLAIDIGSSNAKAALFDSDLNLLYKTQAAYPTFHQAAGWAEQEPRTILSAVLLLIEESLAAHSDLRRQISSIAFSGAMHSLILLNRQGQTLTPSIIWADNRAAAIIEDFKEQADWLDFYQRTGTPIHSMSPFAKLLHFKQGPGYPEGMAKIVGIKEYVLAYFLGDYYMDLSTASATGLFNLQDLDWDQTILDYLGLEPSQLAKLCDTQEKLPLANRQFIQDYGLDPDLQIIVGASDGCLANLASPAFAGKSALVNIGTSGAVRINSQEKILDPLGRTFCYYLLPGQWVVGGPVNNGGKLLVWLSEILFADPKQIFRHLDQALATLPAGSQGLFFIPYLHGERAPHWQPGLTAAYQGLGAHHGRDHLIKALVEGLLFNLREVYLLLDQQGLGGQQLIASGGLCQSPQVCQLMADVFGLPLEFDSRVDSSLLGAILLDPDLGLDGLTGPGQVGDRTYRPDAGRQQQYELLFQEYLAASRKNRPDSDSN